MDPVNGSLQDILDKGASVLEYFFWPDRVMHIAVDWQRMYCDPDFADDPVSAQRRFSHVKPVQDQMSRMVTDLRGVLPMIWGYHAIPYNPTPLQAMILKTLRDDDAQALGYNVFVVEDLSVDKVVHNERSRYSQCWTTAICDGNHCAMSDQVRRVAAKFQP